MAIREHGHAGSVVSSTYQIWRAMKNRCDNPNDKNYKNYGGRGITYCNEWVNFIPFLTDMGEHPTNLSLERIDNNLGYSKDNCKWATNYEQARNRRNNVMVEIDTMQKCVTDWAIYLGIRPNTVICRLSRGWSIDRALGIEGAVYVR